ncbi:MAG: MlaD family protein [Phycisphaerales bacterium]|nr:MlaD family protein [Phycisphaerales bacterium]
MKDRLRDAAIGLAAIAAIVALSAMLLSFGSFRGILQGSYPAEIRLNQAAGLRYGSQVTLDGVPIGRINHVSLDMQQVRPVMLECDINDWARIPMDHQITIEKSLIGGGAVLSILSTTDKSDRLVYEPGDLPVLAGNYEGIGGMLTSVLDERMGPIIESFDAFKALAATYTEVGERVNVLLDENGAEGGGIPAAISRVNQVLDDAQEALQLASSWLNDEQIREDIGNAIFKANLLIESSTEAIGQAGLLAEILQMESTEVSNALVSTADAVDGTLASVRELLGKATEGPGTVSRLLGEDGLYEDLSESVQRLEATLASIQALVDAINAEGLNVEF